ncbi:acid phosphatase [Candidatus Desantisbacteria bacterium CG2_30_40_21]|uniref:Acid phosphatase n=5 Tax=unclassified Candidatus Desantisiibacteriota TaxID=3106372 RepID=A0A2M7JCF4_9BACT|nr:MAG: acid phosphatase [Candidatus Desantisbacteria bacterium CG2_30_40_21]PIP39841.1 MAG: acid phosphatase [Candidatus Desantisbacteria bacterium CG23_combo_of_CG06-09_8_20_14_all_40_23]PIX17071.1 MAG: acid phosphatase [Candidatus Desantisbacteria bacterium CG_4_8_14_3_um_filter_40_12]PIY18657.1 MAG: acid phosphatase [Candidatus Desantisbacteria bacterium CG_4_10_14_3_um_filter_40_18]PJB28082.1 MAG: acid phosphatase [Candidatus Desantisbacteria bacterium CG_4_9_14_3_um_filter_40_11]
MSNNIFVMLKNEIFLSAFLAWLVAQLLKVIIYAARNKKFNFKLLLGSGGMPSSHSATVMALATAIGRTQGWESPMWIVTLTFAIIIMTDAVGVRRAVGQQATILNKMLDEFCTDGKIGETRLKELLGHTPVEVIVGALLGIGMAIVFT